MLKLDHLAVSGATKGDGAAHLATKLSVTPCEGGEHTHFGTHNALLGMGPTFYVEAIAINPAAPPLPYKRWFGLDDFKGPPRLTNWILASDDLDATLNHLGPDYGHPVCLTRGDLRWRMAVPETGILPFDGCAPAIMQWDGDLHPAPMLPDCGVRFQRLVVQHPQAHEMAAIFAPLLGDDVQFRQGSAQLMAEFNIDGRMVELT